MQYFIYYHQTKISPSTQFVVLHFINHTLKKFIIVCIIARIAISNASKKCSSIRRFQKAYKLFFTQNKY